MSKRSVDSKMRKSYSFSRLTFRQRDLWHGLIESVDDQGRMPADFTYIISQVWPYGGVIINELKEDLQKLINNEMIFYYEKRGGSFIQIINWWKYQASSWMGKSDFPAPDGWIDRERYHGKGNNVIEKNWSKQGGFDQLPANKLACQSLNEGDVNGDVNGEGEVNLSAETALSDPAHEDYTSDGGPVIEKKKKKPKDERSMSPAIVSFRRLTGLYPPKVNYEQIISVLGDHPDEAKMKRCYQDWCAHGFKPTNINWLLDWYVNGVSIRGKPSGTLIGADAVKAELERLDQEANNVSG